MNQNEFVIDYGEFVYKTAYKCYWKLKKKPSTDHEEDIICDVAVKIIETFSTKISMGEFKFRGEANIRTYIYGAVFNGMREELFGKQYYPKYVSAHGEAGILLYNLRHLNNYSRREAIELTLQELNTSRTELERIDSEITKSMKSSLVKPKKCIEVNSEDFQFLTVDTPEDEVLRGEVRIKISSILKTLKPISIDLIRMKYIEGMSIDYIIKETGMKDKQAVYNGLQSAKKAFSKEANRQNLSQWIDLDLKGLNNE